MNNGGNINKEREVWNVIEETRIDLNFGTQILHLKRQRLEGNGKDIWNMLKAMIKGKEKQAKIKVYKEKKT